MLTNFLLAGVPTAYFGRLGGSVRKKDINRRVAKAADVTKCSQS
jgi:hypothetical protein